MKTKLYKAAVSFLIPVVFWISVWWLISKLIDFSFIFPTPNETIAAFFALLFTKNFVLSVIFSLFRIILGFALGVALGISVAILTNKFSLLRSIISPVMVVLKSTPVASFIMILWFFFSSNNIPVIIAIFMVMPVIWQSTTDGLCAINSELAEVCETFSFPFKKKMKLLIFPSVLKFLLPAVISSSGLAWKAGVAAEIITYTRLSLGELIYNAKLSLDGPFLFATTCAVVILSLIIEALIKFLLGRVKKV